MGLAGENGFGWVGWGFCFQATQSTQSTQSTHFTLNDTNASNDLNKRPYHSHPKIDFRSGFATLGKKVTDG